MGNRLKRAGYVLGSGTLGLAALIVAAKATAEGQFLITGQSVDYHLGNMYHNFQSALNSVYNWLISDNHSLDRIGRDYDGKTPWNRTENSEQITETKPDVRSNPNEYIVEREIKTDRSLVMHHNGEGSSLTFDPDQGSQETYIPREQFISKIQVGIGDYATGQEGTGHYKGELLAGDANGDGKYDLEIANGETKTVWEIRNHSEVNDDLEGKIFENKEDAVGAVESTAVTGPAEKEYTFWERFNGAGGNIGFGGAFIKNLGLRLAGSWGMFIGLVGLQYKLHKSKKEWKKKTYINDTLEYIAKDLKNRAEMIGINIPSSNQRISDKELELCIAIVDDGDQIETSTNQSLEQEVQKIPKIQEIQQILSKDKLNRAKMNELTKLSEDASLPVEGLKRNDLLEQLRIYYRRIYYRYDDPEESQIETQNVAQNVEQEKLNKEIRELVVKELSDLRIGALKDILKTLREEYASNVSIPYVYSEEEANADVHASIIDAIRKGIYSEDFKTDIKKRKALINSFEAKTFTIEDVEKNLNNKNLSKYELKKLEKLINKKINAKELNIDYWHSIRTNNIRKLIREHNLSDEEIVEYLNISKDYVGSDILNDLRDEVEREKFEEDMIAPLIKIYPDIAAELGYELIDKELSDGYGSISNDPHLIGGYYWKKFIEWDMDTLNEKLNIAKKIFKQINKHTDIQSIKTILRQNGGFELLVDIVNEMREELSNSKKNELIKRSEELGLPTKNKKHKELIEQLYNYYNYDKLESTIPAEQPTQAITQSQPEVSIEQPTRPYKVVKREIKEKIRNLRSEKKNIERLLRDKEKQIKEYHASNNKSYADSFLRDATNVRQSYTVQIQEKNIKIESLKYQLQKAKKNKKKNQTDQQVSSQNESVQTPDQPEQEASSRVAISYTNLSAEESITSSDSSSLVDEVDQKIPDLDNSDGDQKETQETSYQENIEDNGYETQPQIETQETSYQENIEDNGYETQPQIETQETSYQEDTEDTQASTQSQPQIETQETSYQEDTEDNEWSFLLTL